MSKDVIGLINMQNTRPLTEINARRPIASLPVGGKYRLVDFTLSNMVNAGVTSVGILLPRRSRSVLDHLRSGKEWGLAHKGDGLFYLPMEETEKVDGDVDSYYNNLMLVKRGHKEYLLLSNCDRVQNVNYEKVLHFHRQHNADVTMIYKVKECDATQEGTIFTTDEEGRITSITPVKEQKAGEKLFTEGMVVDCDMFIDSVERAYAKGYKNFVDDVLQKNLQQLRIFGYHCGGYSKKIDSVESYFKVNMDLMDPVFWKKLFFPDPEHRIYTKSNDEAPAKYTEEAKVKNSLIANGCIIEGTVENSILFRRVKVGPNAVVKNSIVMQYTVVGDDAQLDHVICDKRSLVQTEATLSGTEKKPLCVGKRSVS